MPWWAICFTIVATETSTLTFIGVPGDRLRRQHDVPPARDRLHHRPRARQRCSSSRRTSAASSSRRTSCCSGVSARASRTLSAVIFLITRSLADGIRLFATALVIAVVTQVPVTVDGRRPRRGDDRLHRCAAASSAVIWTDVVQMFVYVAGALAVVLGAAAQIPGGWADGRCGRRRRPASSTILDLSFDPARVYTFWAGLLGGVALTLATHGTDQFLVQRLLSARSAREASTGLVLSGVHRLRAVHAVPAHRRDALHLLSADAAARSRSRRTDEILPLFVVTALPTGVAGFIVAAIVAAALSPSLNAMAATTVNDFYLPYVSPGADQPTLMRVSKQATIVWGIVQLGVALGAQWMDRSVLDAGLAVLSFALRSGARRVPARHLVIRGTRARGARRHARRTRRDDGGVVGNTNRLDLVCADRRLDDSCRGLAGTRILGVAATGRREMTSFPRTHAVLGEAIARRVFPGAVVEIGSTRETIAMLSAGSLSYDAGAAPVTADTVYDLASLTKVLSTATLASVLVDRGVLHLDDRVNVWSPAWHGSDRDAVTLRLLLLHASGLPAHRRYFERLRGGAAFEAAIGHEPLEYEPGTQSVPRTRASSCSGAFSNAPMVLSSTCSSRPGCGQTSVTGQRCSSIQPRTRSNESRRPSRIRGARACCAARSTTRMQPRSTASRVTPDCSVALRASGNCAMVVKSSEPRAMENVRVTRRRAGQFAGARVGHDVADLVVRHVYDARSIRAHRLHGNLAVDRSVTGPLRRVPLQPRPSDARERWDCRRSSRTSRRDCR